MFKEVKHSCINLSLFLVKYYINTYYMKTAPQHEQDLLKLFF